MSEAPGIRDSIIEDAFGMLKWDDCDMVLGPAENGAYFLIGANRRMGIHTIGWFCILYGQKLHKNNHQLVST